MRVFLFVWIMMCVPLCAHARDVRLALLVANQHGWKGDPRLRYAIKGDLVPLKRALKQLGFRVWWLPNRNATTLRKAFSRLSRRLTQTPRVTTFLFYYSGHADQHHFHLGPKGKKPFSYKEFARRFRALRVMRKFAIFDACFSGEIIRLLGSLSRFRALRDKGQFKGIQRRTTFDISKLSFPNQGNEQGIRVISSSLRLSWEIHRYKASVFTYFLLRGLKGAADLDQDGKISLDELFDFTSRQVKKETGQKPEQLIIAKRKTPYALAPAYRSRLSIRADVLGQLRVSVRNFVWTYHKKRRRRMLLSVVDGNGEVLLRGKRFCWKQVLHFPKGGQASLRRWQRTPCKTLAIVRKGTVELGGAPRAYELVHPAHFVSAGASLDSLVGGLFGQNTPRLGMGFQFGVFRLGVGVSTGPISEKSYWLTRSSLALAMGWPWELSLFGHSWMVYAAAYVEGGVGIQHTSERGFVQPVFGGGDSFM